MHHRFSSRRTQPDPLAFPTASRRLAKRRYSFCCSAATPGRYFQPCFSPTTRPWNCTVRCPRSRGNGPSRWPRSVPWRELPPVGVPGLQYLRVPFLFSFPVLWTRPVNLVCSSDCSKWKCRSQRHFLWHDDTSTLRARWFGNRALSRRRAQRRFPGGC